MIEQKNDIHEVLHKYLEEERDLEKKLQECDRARQELRCRGDGSKIDTDPSATSRCYQREESHVRNQQLLKDFEKAKAILRTESTFTPNEQELRDLASAYRRFL
ncbi:uncharacterized protein LOC131674191 [Phymastichus coffea]|uniref:uncharacterized protein LOC131674191 n=1 Tax=Phymastichus coffea TaxID=108790 RepID=UPI00273B585D|nr:uncharacterized protein LOC131674191 [Phymastichus coffea]